jgi:hypothetical protein
LLRRVAVDQLVDFVLGVGPFFGGSRSVLLPARDHVGLGLGDSGADLVAPLLLSDYRGNRILGSGWSPRGDAASGRGWSSRTACGSATGGCGWSRWRGSAGVAGGHLGRQRLLRHVRVDLVLAHGLNSIALPLQPSLRHTAVELGALLPDALGVGIPFERESGRRTGRNVEGGIVRRQVTKRCP